MKRQSERGVALVITLIMLALVTFMAVVFLAISRREKSSVTVTGDMVNARLMTDTAVARAQSELVSRILTSTNPFDYDLIVSTNYYNPAGFQPGNTNTDNVSFDRRRNGSPMQSGQPGSANFNDWVHNIANLQFDARVPVFVSTNLTGLTTNDFRFFVDFNRNGYFEPTGLYFDNENPRAGTNFYVGDPQWIGVLERPDLPHSESNRFIGRYAYIVLPAGKSLDLNYIHNSAKRLSNNQSLNDYMRNQGVGSWEINLAGFLAMLNTNATAWPINLAYGFSTNLVVPSTGFAFDDASSILRHRYERNLSSLASAKLLLNPSWGPNNPFTTNGIDYYADGPLASAPLLVADNVNLPWSGSYNTNGFYDVQELFDTNKTSIAFVSRLTSRATNSNLLYDRYTFYRLLSQMGVDSRVQESNKVYFSDLQQHYTNRMHLLYKNTVPNGQTNFIPWTPISFFTNAADRLLRASLDRLVTTNGVRRDTNFMLGLTPVRTNFCSTSIQLFHANAGKVLANQPFYTTNNEYTAATHRLLQLAANIYDATTVRHLGTTNDFPSVFRPVFMRTNNLGNSLIICGFIEEPGIQFLNNPWMTIEQAAATVAQNVTLSNLNLYGVPLVIGAKKGYPNFNKLVVQTVADVSRRLEIRRAGAGGPPIETNQMYVIGVSNRFGIEGWNSYARDYSRPLELRVTGQSQFALHHKPEGAGAEYPPRFHTLLMGSTNVMGRWPGGASNIVAQNSFVVAVDTNIASLPSSIYLTRTGALVPQNTNVFEKSFRVPQWSLSLTNRLQYMLIDVNARRIVDFVNLDKLVNTVDLTHGLVGDTNAGGGGIFSDKNRNPAGGKAVSAPLTDGDMWNPSHSAPANLDSPSLGTINQISVAKGTPFVGEGTWANSNGQLEDKSKAILQFVEFMTGQLTNLTWQVPFTPSRRLYLRSSWEANDPLVHYTAEDLTEPIVPGSTNSTVQPINFNFPLLKDALLRELNPRFRPWGGKPDKDPSSDPTAYALTLKDPLIKRSDDWQFPTNQFPTVGWLGRVHRGTPWQTVYIKSPADPATGQPVDLLTWSRWAGNAGTHPTNDWKLLDLFTVAPNDNASRGLLAVNQTNTASWAAVLGGVTVLTNVTTDAAVGPSRPPQYRSFVVAPNSPQLSAIVDGINRARLQQTNRTYRTVGDVLAAPELTVESPFLNRTARQRLMGIDDAAYERIPMQVLSLLRTDEPRVAVYAFGQSLKPADRSLVTVSTVNPPIFNLCTNYQVTGEFATKTVFRLEDLPPEPISRDIAAPVSQKMRAVVESYTILQPE